MTGDQQRLLQDWIDRVMSRPSHECGVFVGSEGQPFGTRARPWDEPDLMISGLVQDDGITVDLDCYGARITWEITGITEVEPADHPWGAGLRVVRAGAVGPEVVWLV